jgi:hypothetical protein
VISDESMVLVYGDPAGGFQFVGPVTPNDPDLEDYIERELRGVSWWYVPLRSLDEARRDVS